MNSRSLEWSDRVSPQHQGRQRLLAFAARIFLHQPRDGMDQLIDAIDLKTDLPAILQQFADEMAIPLRRVPNIDGAATRGVSMHPSIQIGEFPYCNLQSAKVVGSDCFAFNDWPHTLAEHDDLALAGWQSGECLSRAFLN